MTDKKTEALKPCEYCGHQLPQGVDKRTRQVRSHHFASCKVRLEQKALAEQPAQQQEPVAHCEAGPEHCPVCLAETRSLALAAAVGYIQRNTPRLVSEEICRALENISPQSKPWVGLTDEEIGDIEITWEATQEWACFRYAARAIEAKLKEKNNG